DGGVVFFEDPAPNDNPNASLGEFAKDVAVDDAGDEDAIEAIGEFFDASDDTAGGFLGGDFDADLAFLSGDGQLVEQAAETFVAKAHADGAEAETAIIGGTTATAT